MTRSEKLLLLGALYLAQGLPYGFFTQALPVLMRDAGYSLIGISATTLLFVPWALKFLWAPYVDRYGTRRHWLLPLQLATAAGAALLASLDLSHSLLVVFVALLVFNLLAATQDIATDGLAVVMLGPRERGAANGLQVGAYRLGMVLGGGALLWIYSVAGWRPMFAAMAVLLALTVLPVLRLREAPRTAIAGHPAASRMWRRRLRQPGFALFAVLICCYRFGDSMGAALVGPFMRDTGLTLAQIAWLKGTLASLSALLGAAVGGWLTFSFGRRPMLLIAGLAQTLSLALYACAAAGIGGYPLLAGACIAEHVFGAAATVAAFTLMMDAADPDHAGTDYTLLACAAVIAQGAAVLLAGLVAQSFGYTPMFIASVLLSAGGCLLLLRTLDRGRGPARLYPLWRAGQTRPISAS